MITASALHRFTDNRLNTLCLCFEKAFAAPEEEAIHDLRVALRRLLTHLNFLSFVFDQHPDADGICRRHHKKLKRCLKSLNTLRDLHIQIQYLQRLPKDSAYPLSFLEALKALEKQKLATLSQEMDQWTFPKTRARVKEALHSVPVGDRELELKAHLYLNYLTQELHESVHMCHTPDLPGCHRLRVRLKHYRYHLEMLEQGFGLKQILMGAVKEWQDDLGALQDLRVLLEEIQRADTGADSGYSAFRAQIQTQLDNQLAAVRDEVFAIRFETQLK